MLVSAAFAFVFILVPTDLPGDDPFVFMGASDTEADKFGFEDLVEEFREEGWYADVESGELALVDAVVGLSLDEVGDFVFDFLIEAILEGADGGLGEFSGSFWGDHEWLLLFIF